MCDKEKGVVINQWNIILSVSCIPYTLYLPKGILHKRYKSYNVKGEIILLKIFPFHGHITEATMPNWFSFFLRVGFVDCVLIF